MMRVIGHHRWYHVLLLWAGVTLCATSQADAQKATERRGFNTTLTALVTGQELNAQSDLWVLEVSFRPMRMIRVDITDPQTKTKQRKLVWYLVYKAINRPLPKRDTESDLVPVNTFDPVPRPIFVPEFQLVTEDDEKQQIYADVILPEARAAIIRRERLPLKNATEIVREIPALTAPGEPENDVIHGVVMWQDVAPSTDYFTVFMSGFSSGYRLEKGPDGEPLTLRRTIVQQFWRPGDRFDQSEREIRKVNDPLWIYRPDDLDEDTADAEPEPPTE